MHTDDLITAEQLEQMGSAGRPFELVRGRLVRVNPVNHEHGHVAVLVATALQNFVQPRGLGRVMVEAGYTLARGPDIVRGPDVSFVRAGHPNYPPTRGFFSGAPDLAVEVRSPDNPIAELLAKADEYLTAGTELVWIIDVEVAIVLVMRPGVPSVALQVGDTLDGGATLPGFTLPLSEFLGPR